MATMYFQLFFMIQIVLLLSCLNPNFSSSVETSSKHASPKQWCQYLRKNPEPKLILYNRMAKCGSTTMENLFRVIASSKRSKLHSWSAPKAYWVDLDNSTTIRNNFIKAVNSKSTNMSFIVDGHWEQYDFSRNSFGNKSFENIQLVRDCVARRRSMFFYSIYNSRAMTALKRKLNSSEFENAQKLRLNTDNLESCFNNYQCLTKPGAIERFSASDAELKMLCGSECKRRNLGNQSRGALANARDPKVFTVIGSLSRFSEFLEMLECAYPRGLRGIRSIYDRHEVSSKNQIIILYMHSNNFYLLFIFFVNVFGLIVSFQRGLCA